MSEETKQPEPQQLDTQEAPAGSAPADNLNINDLMLVRQIIATAQSRGAFRAEEMEAIGSVYNKLDGFLKKIEETAQAQQGPAPENAGVEDTTETPVADKEPQAEEA